jgi:enoyl-CoA hydratase/carnithine racemase
MLTHVIEDAIVIATFCGGKYNTISQQTLQELRQVLKIVAETADIKGLVLTGQGKTFSSGFDLASILAFQEREQAVLFFRLAEEVLFDLFTCPKPVVCAMNGAAVAGGFIFSMAVDYRIVKNHPKIKLGMPEIKMGLGLTPGQTEIMRFGIDSNRHFRDVMYFGELYDVQSAKQAGLVDEVVEEDVIARAKQIVTTWANNPGHALSIFKTYYRKPYADRIRERMKDQDWKTNLIDVLFSPEVRKALAFSQSMMV